ncbi:amino acid permease [Corynebacterium sp. sy017]|uniref:amino acid permease n=1 Tax=unclassified Corynebacterium TaxID=2624378 RepID=UPI001185B675|nr:MULTISPECIES: amino acid permease [unclassified Corynebacterium]MBP3087948.1 amino acid permease [Corynebacterium sp. sy017]TSD92483.1 amino acid permease [Corynebacterium sp. SY003]
MCSEATSHHSFDDFHAQETAGYRKDLKHRHIHMIALGGALGTGLFLGAGERLNIGGPGLALVYAVCGIIGYLMLRSLGEMVIYRPTSGSFASYSREFLGQNAAFFAGWIYFIAWVTVGIAELTAIAVYLKFWPLFAQVPQWILVACALCLVVGVNLIGVKFFGEAEFWFAFIKVAAIIIFMLIGVAMIVSGTTINGHAPGLSTLGEGGGWFPHGIMPLIVMTQGVIFAYAGIDMIGVAAGETQNPGKEIPRAINTTVVRIIFFYVGSVFLLALLLPSSAYSGTESPFVTFMNAIGIPAAADIMNMVVLTAALSSVNAGLYATARILKPLAHQGLAPVFLAKMSSHGVPTGGIWLTTCFFVGGVVLNYVVPAQAFEIVLGLGAIAILGMWAIISCTHIGYIRAAKNGKIMRHNYRTPGGIGADIIVLLFLGGVFVLMILDYPQGTYTAIIALIVFFLLFIGGLWLTRKNANRKYV